MATIIMRGGSKVVALVSGGVDSLALTAWARASGRVVPVYVRCGLAWEPAELRAVRRWLAALGSARVQALQVMDLPLRSWYGAHWSVRGRGVPSATSADAAVYLPGRNLLLASAAAICAVRQKASAIAFGTLAANPFDDATPAFFTSLGRCLSRAFSRPLRILAPLRRMTKAQVMARYPALPYALTMSCLQPRGDRHCGRCNKCAERRRAFRAARVPDPTIYMR